MKEKLKEFISYLAIIIPITYIIGFIIINSYLSKYGVTDNEIISVTYLKASLLYSFLCLMIISIIIVTYTKPTDNFKINAHEHILFFHNFLFFCSLVAPILFCSFTAIPIISLFSFSSIGFYAFLVYISIRYLIWRPRFSKTSHFVYYYLFLSFFLIVYLLSLSIQYPVIAYFIASFFMTGIYLSLEYGDYKDGTYRIDKLTFAILLLILAAGIYGRNVYGALPSYLGGPRNSFNEIYLKDSIIIGKTKTDKISNKEIVYSSATIYFIQVNDSTLFQLNKDMVKYINYKIKLNK